MSKKYINKSKLQGKIGTENYRISNCPFHIPKENVKFFKTMQNAGNSNPFSSSIFANQVNPDWQKEMYESIMNVVAKEVKKALNENQYNLALDNFENIKNSKNSLKTYNDVINSKEEIKKIIELNKFNNYCLKLKEETITYEEFRNLIKLYKTYGFKYKVESSFDYGCENLKRLINFIINEFNDENADLNFIDISEIKDLSGLFENSKFNGDISDWDVSHVNDMSRIFKSSAYDGDYSDISNWDVSHVKYMEQMFYCSPFNKPDICNWDVSSVMSTSEMFFDSMFCQDISEWNLPLGCDICYMFSADFPQKYKPKVNKEILLKAAEQFGEDVTDTEEFEDERLRSYDSNGDFVEYDEDDEDVNEGFMFEGECGECGGVSGAYNTPMNTVGVGNIIPAGQPAISGSSQASDINNGSGDITISTKKNKKQKKYKLTDYFPIATKK